jgi:LytS/YehU family sensor histidine kinase
MDQSDPYGPQFQLRLVFWILLAHMILSWIFNQWKLTKQLQNERVDAELMHLKSQINPHFFFNTLNNLYGLAREKSDQTPDLILRLSDMMRYTIYQGKKEQVAIEAEITYLDNFIELQKIRFQKNVQVCFKTDIDDTGTKVSPLLFINLLENAYKHGVEKLTDEAFVNIQLTVKQGKLTFSIDNNFDIKQITSEKGIGISNLTKRLELLYPGKHSFNSSVDNDRFNAVVTIDLSTVRAV